MYISSVHSLETFDYNISKIVVRTGHKATLACIILCQSSRWPNANSVFCILIQDFGTSGYSRNTASASGSQSSIESDVAGFHINEPPRDMSRQMSKGDQYVTIVGAGLLEDEMEPVQEEEEEEYDSDGCDDDGYDYLRMEPGSYDETSSSAVWAESRMRTDN